MNATTVTVPELYSGADESGVSLERIIILTNRGGKSALDLTAVVLDS